jgi:hypothetical protein
MSKKTQKIILDLGIDPNKIFTDIDYIVKSCNTTYSDAVVHYCQTSNVDIETVGELIKTNPKIKFALQVEYESVNLLPKTSRLPI